MSRAGKNDIPGKIRWAKVQMHEKTEGSVFWIRYAEQMVEGSGGQEGLAFSLLPGARVAMSGGHYTRMSAPGKGYPGFLVKGNEP